LTVKNNKYNNKIEPVNAAVMTRTRIRGRSSSVRRS